MDEDKTQKQQEELEQLRNTLNAMQQEKEALAQRLSAIERNERMRENRERTARYMREEEKERQQKQTTWGCLISGGIFLAFILYLLFTPMIEWRGEVTMSIAGLWLLLLIIVAAIYRK